MVTVGIFPFKESSHGRAGNRTRDLMISIQRLWPLDHEAGQGQRYSEVDNEGSSLCWESNVGANNSDTALLIKHDFLFTVLLREMSEVTAGQYAAICTK